MRDDSPTTKRMRKRLLDWHYKKDRRVDAIDLLESDFKCFQNAVSRRLRDTTGEDREITFRESIKLATEDELRKLDLIILDRRLGI